MGLEWQEHRNPLGNWKCISSRYVSFKSEMGQG